MRSLLSEGMGDGQVCPLMKIRANSKGSKSSSAGDLSWLVSLFSDNLMLIRLREYGAWPQWQAVSCELNFVRLQREGDAPAEPNTSFSSATAGGFQCCLRRTPTCGRIRLGRSLALPIVAF